MTNEAKPSAEEIARWERIKQDMLDRADVVSHFTDLEAESLRELGWAAMCIDESRYALRHAKSQKDLNNLFSVDHFGQVIVANYILVEENCWDKSENDDKRQIGKLCAELASAIQDDLSEDGEDLSITNMKRFGHLWSLIHNFERTKPNKYQMERFAEHGIIWEGEVDEH
jgi:predicted dithiol-disulfide oxidoreductase (DUF899 family)